jgi:hypothetical protein
MVIVREITTINLGDGYRPPHEHWSINRRAASSTGPINDEATVRQFPSNPRHSH